ncbi:MAG: hypothetical protein K9N07_10210 [Candidatus Cloacimonetes bacterium]|nr:hypothetical protein [Candidatus Cloacimonadota bacterium]
MKYRICILMIILFYYFVCAGISVTDIGLNRIKSINHGDLICGIPFVEGDRRLAAQVIYNTSLVMRDELTHISDYFEMNFVEVRYLDNIGKSILNFEINDTHYDYTSDFTSIGNRRYTYNFVDENPFSHTQYRAYRLLNNYYHWLKFITEVYKYSNNGMESVMDFWYNYLKDCLKQRNAMIINGKMVMNESRNSSIKVIKLDLKVAFPNGYIKQVFEPVEFDYNTSNIGGTKKLIKGSLSGFFKDLKYYLLDQ